MTLVKASEYKFGWLTASSVTGEQPQEVLNGDFDLAIASSSWDRRSTCITETSITAATAVGLFFDNKGTGNLRDAHDLVINEFLGTCARDYRPLKGRSEDLAGIASQLTHVLEETVTQVGRPIRLLVDLSTCPRYFSLGTIADAFRRQLVRTCVVFYAEGRYPKTDGLEQDLFTLGELETVPIPGLPGSVAPGRQRKLVVSVGFEGSKVLKAANAFDPDLVGALLPRPGVQPDYERRSQAAAERLIEAYQVQATDVLYAPASDAVAAWKILAENHPYDADQDISYLLCGTKPHSLAMALHSLTANKAGVFYLKPAAHRQVPTESLGKYWRFTLDDLSIPSAP